MKKEGMIMINRNPLRGICRRHFLSIAIDSNPLRGILRRSFLLIIIFTFTFHLSPFTLQAQDEGDYNARFTELSRAFARNPQDEVTLYNLALFYFDNSNPMRNLPQAIEYVRLTEQRHVDLLERNRVRDLVQLQRNNNITLTTIRDLKQAIHSAAMETVRLHDDLTMAELDHYLEHFSDNADLVRLLRTRRYQLVYNNHLASGSAADCYSFMLTYPGTAEAERIEGRLVELTAPAFAACTTAAAVDAVAARYPKSTLVRRAADRRKSAMAFQAAEADGSIEAYNAFLTRYPASDESEEARERISQLLEADLAKRTTAVELAHFADSNADLDIADRALARLRALIYSRRDVQAAQYYVDHFKLDDYRSEVYSRYYSWYALEGNGAPLRRFADANPDFPYPRALEDDLERAAEIDTAPLLDDYVDVYYERYAAYVRLMMGKGIAIVPLQRMLQPLLAAHRYDDALSRMEQFEICFDNKWQRQYESLRRLIATPSQNGERRMENGERRMRNGERRTLSREGDVWIAEYDVADSNWRVTDLPPYPVNTDYIETDAFLLPDGSGMLLASDRPGGFNLQASGDNFHGDTALATDLWFIPYTGHGWGTPVNLGPKVNTPYCERYPVISRNLKTLYFVSDGHTGLGYGDIYVVERSDLSDWTSWGEPRNLGRDVNSSLREADLCLSADERQLYFSSDISGQWATYSVATRHDTSGSVYSLNVSDINSSLVRLYVADVDHQTVTRVVDCDGDAAVGINLRRGRRYALLADAGTNFVTATVVDPDHIEDYRLPAYTYADLVAMDRPLPLPMVQFSASGTELLPVAQLQLEQLARFLAAHPTAIAEILVDVPGIDASHCYTLSLQRAEALRDFLSQRGIAASRLMLSPYGNANAGLSGQAAVSIRFRE